MLTLAIDTATKVCTIALARDGEILAEYDVNVGMTHSEGLLPQIEQLINRTGIDKKAIDLLAVSMGPGSFTGLRIGLATAEAMAYSWQCMLHGVDTLKALAYNIPIEGIILSPVLDAQKGNYYQAIYEWVNGELVEHEAVSVVSKDEMLAKAAAYGKTCYLLGETKRLENMDLGALLKLAPKTLRMPKASSVALLAELEHTEEDKKIFGLEPYYIRRSEAEELWEKRQQK